MNDEVVAALEFRRRHAVEVGGARLEHRAAAVRTVGRTRRPRVNAERRTSWHRRLSVYTHRGSTGNETRSRRYRVIRKMAVIGGFTVRDVRLASKVSRYLSILCL